MCRQTQIKSKKDRSCLKKSSLSILDDAQVITVPTFNDAPERQIDIAKLSSSEISSLKSDDPFMYYSIPSVREASMRNREVDLSALTASFSASDSSSDKKAIKVTRQRRVSTECYPDSWTDTLNDLEFMAAVPRSATEENHESSSEDDEDDLFGIYYKSLTQMK
jgi:hypothetical protein